MPRSNQLGRNPLVQSDMIAGLGIEERQARRKYARVFVVETYSDDPRLPSNPQTGRCRRLATSAYG